MRGFNILFTLGVLLLGLCHSASAQTEREILEYNWKGYSKLEVDFTQSGYAYLRQNFILDIDDRYNMTGRAITTFTFDGVDYVYKVYLSGHYDEPANMLTYETGDSYYADKLPQGLQWCNGWGELELVKDLSRPGHYMLKGYEKDDCGGDGEMELFDAN